MITAIAIDDEPKAIQVIEHHVSKCETITLLGYFYNANEALQFLKQNPVDLIFLDINMPNKSGIEMLQELKLQPFVIFTTAYAEFAIDSYGYNTVDYLLKPFEFDQFQIAVNKVEERIAQKKQDTFFFIKDGFKNIKIEFESVLFVRGSGNYLDIITVDGAYAPRMTFVDIVEKLNASLFIRVHQSYLVNIASIDKIENNHIHIDTHKIPISSRYKEMLFKRLDLC